MLIIKELKPHRGWEMYNMIGCESEPNHLEEKDCYSSTQHDTHYPLDHPEGRIITLDTLEATIQHGSDEQFQEMLRPLSEGISLHAEHKLFGSKLLHYRLMKCYYRTFKAMREDSLHDQANLIFLLSLMAELARRREGIKLPFTKNIVLAMLSFDGITLKQSPYSGQVIRILAVLLENLSRQGRTAGKLGVEGEVMNGLLLLTSRVDELFTLRILIRAIRQLPRSITKGEVEKSGVLSGLRDNFGEEVAIRVRMMLREGSVRKEEGQKTLKDLISNM